MKQSVALGHAVAITLSTNAGKRRNVLCQMKPEVVLLASTKGAQRVSATEDG